MCVLSLPQCFTCQHVFDATESKLMPLLKDTPPSPSPQPRSLGGHQRTSLANRFCPFCMSQQLQYISNSQPFHKPLTPLATSTSPRVGVHSEHTGADSTGQTTHGNVKSGLADGSSDKTKETIVTRECTWEHLEDAYSYDDVTSTHHNDAQSHQDSSENVAPPKTEQQYSTSSWSFGELSGNQEAPQHVRSSHDVLYHAGMGTEGARCDTRDIDNSCTSDTGQLRRDTTETFTDNQARHKYNTFHSRSHRTGSGGMSNSLSQSGSKSRLTHSEPTPKLQSCPDTCAKPEVSSQQTKDFRHSLSSKHHETKGSNPFDEREMMYKRLSSGSTSSLPRMKLQQGTLGSVQERQVPKSLNPFEEVESTGNPFVMEEDEESLGEKEKKSDGDESWNAKARAHSFSQKEERYFPNLHSHSQELREEEEEDRPDLHMPVRRNLQRVPPSSSVPAASYMTAFAGQVKLGNFSRNQPKSSTLPYRKGPRSMQETPELSSKRSTTLPRGKPPLYGAGMVRGKSMESLDRFSPRNEHHPSKSNRISIFSRKKGENLSDGYTSRYSVGREGGMKAHSNSSKPPRNSSASPVITGSSGSGKSTPESTKRGHSSSDTQSTGRGQFIFHA